MKYGPQFITQPELKSLLGIIERLLGINLLTPLG